MAILLGDSSQEIPINFQKEPILSKIISDIAEESEEGSEEESTNVEDI